MFGALFLRGADVVVALTAYFDCAGHPAQGSALTLGGYIASVRQWHDLFDRKWTKELAKAGIFCPFHMTDFINGGKEFREWRGQIDKQDILLKKLAKIIKQHTRIAVSQTVLLDDWNRANKVYALRKNNLTPYALAGFFVMDKSLRWLKGRQKDAQCQFFFENGDADKGTLIHLIDQVVRTNKARLSALRMSGSNFVSKHLTPLQAADFAIWEQNCHVKERLKDPAYKSRSTLELILAIKGQRGVVGYKEIIDFCERFGVPKIAEKRKWTFVSVSPAAAQGAAHP